MIDQGKQKVTNKIVGPINNIQTEYNSNLVETKPFSATNLSNKSNIKEKYGTLSDGNRIVSYE